MQALDKETFSYWVTHPDDLTQTDFVQLRESLQAYPYCQALHTLAAKAASVHQKGQTITYVRQAAAYALSRNALRKLIDNEFQWSDNLLTKLNELSARHVPIPEDYQQESYALFKSKVGLSNSFPKMPLIRLPEPAPLTQTNGVLSDSAETTPTPDDPTLSETVLQNDLAQKTATPAPEPVIPQPDPERQRQLDLIEQFIRNEPRISPLRSKLDANESSEQEDLTKRSQPASGNLVTEAFAKILEKQGKINKAVEIYEQLILKNPQKKAYFAAKISELTRSQVTSSK